MTKFHIHQAKYSEGRMLSYGRYKESHRKRRLMWGLRKNMVFPNTQSFFTIPNGHDKGKSDNEDKIEENTLVTTSTQEIWVA